MDRLAKSTAAAESGRRLPPSTARHRAPPIHWRVPAVLDGVMLQRSTWCRGRGVLVHLPAERWRLRTWSGCRRRLTETDIRERNAARGRDRPSSAIQSYARSQPGRALHRQAAAPRPVRRFPGPNWSRSGPSGPEAESSARSYSQPASASGRTPNTNLTESNTFLLSVSPTDTYEHITHFSVFPPPAAQALLSAPCTQVTWSDLAFPCSDDKVSASNQPRKSTGTVES